MNLHGNLFTTVAIDNIDHKLSSTNASGSFLGTGISLFQHPDKTNNGNGHRQNSPILDLPTRQVFELPEQYTTINPIQLQEKDVHAPEGCRLVRWNGRADPLQKESIWLQSEKSNIVDDVPNTNISWVTYHASKMPQEDVTPAISALLPLFPNDSKPVAMIRHAMEVVWKAIKEVNPGQLHVVILDQPLYIQ